jgi:hypothetical protein
MTASEFPSRKDKELDMNPNDAAAHLADVARTQRRLAERARWPFHRHAMFGLSEGLLVAGIAQPTAIGLGMMGVAMALFALCVTEDRRRHGMFVSGWQAGATRPLTVLIVLFTIAMAVASAVVRDGETVQPLGYLIGAFTFAVCTAGSLRWERIYRGQLSGEAGQ